ncbi:hypothetical protein [Dysgonomonas sp. 25]|uniref:hypothetical protein n=1 Tax=Dysgonomonas sp. 25 TaxID=2302933 RepID=UPI0013D1D89B|nr:hypothetical protein [Dysgonomonas sp. 25]NDV67315.1 hypothetical protein [Dysgonomonas sp. 25]
MSKLSLLFLFLLMNISVLAQDIVCTVYNIDDTPLSKVQAKNLKTGRICYSDKDGVVKIEGNRTDTISFMLNGYSPTELTITNILHSQNKIYLFPQMQLMLSEVTVTPIDIYAIYETAAANLKRRLIKNKEQAYKCVGIEKEVNLGSMRSTEFLFTANLKKANPKRATLNYTYLLAQLKNFSDAENSNIMQGNNLWISLFLEYIPKNFTKSEKNSFHISDSTIVIYNKSHDSGIVSYTINREDTTLVGMSHELITPKEKYTRRRTFKAKNLYRLITIQYAKNNDGYYLNSLNEIHDISFLLGKPQREERLRCTYKIEAIDTVINADLKFKPDTKKLYKMADYDSATSNDNSD